VQNERFILHWRNNLFYLESTLLAGKLFDDQISVINQLTSDKTQYLLDIVSQSQKALEEQLKKPGQMIQNFHLIIPILSIKFVHETLQSKEKILQANTEGWISVKNVF